MLKTDRQKKVPVPSTQKGTKSHSKFFVNKSEDLDESLYDSAPQFELNKASSNGYIFKMSDSQKGMPRQYEPESSASSEPKTASNIRRNRSLRSLTRSKTAEEEPGVKHHLEQVFITPPFYKKG